MELSSTRSNIIYTLFLIITIPTFFMLITSRAWYDKANKNYSEDYNTTCSIGGYYIKISNAVYVTDKDYLQFTYSVKEIDTGTAEGDEPVLKSVWLDSEDRSLDFDVGSEEISKTVVCRNATTDFKKAIIKISFKEADTVIPEKYDEFGDVIPGSIEKGEEIVERITIDKKDIDFISSDDLATMITTKADLTIDDNSEQPDSTVAASHSSYVSILPQTTSKTSQNSTATVTKKTDIQSESSRSAAAATSLGSNQTEQQSNAASYQPTYTRQHSTSAAHNTTTTVVATTKKTISHTTGSQPSTSKTTTLTTAKTTRKTTHSTTKSTTIHIPINGIKLSSDFDANNIILTVNQSTNVSAVISPSSATNKNVAWTSNRSDIASVDANGKITAHSSGKAIITATTQDGQLSASCMVSVS